MYTHGVSGNQIPSQDAASPSGVATLPVYIGTAPVQQLTDYSGAINKPLVLYSFDDAKAKIGYSDDWDTFTLCEAVYAHFKNKIGNIGPIVVINVFDPATDTVAGTASVILTNKIGYINDPAVLSTIAIGTKVKDTDFSVSYETDGRIKLTVITTIASPATVTYNKMDITKVSENKIVGGIDDESGKRTGISCIDLIYQQNNLIPTLLAAPGWSDKITIYNALVAKCQKINGHWDAVCAVDIDCSVDGGKTIATAITKMQTDGFTSKYSKVCWPMEKDGDKIYHLSTMAVVRMMQTDYSNDNTPFVSPSNKQIMASGAVLADGTAIEFDEVQANVLNASGITTINYVGGQWRLWGPHMGNYKYGADILPEDKFDCSIRMQQFLTNTFQVKYMNDVDGPLPRKKVDSILDDSGIWLNGLVAEGKMLYGDIQFLETSNSIGDIVDGEFKFDVADTTTPPGKSLSFNVQYTTQGLNSLFTGTSQASDAAAALASGTTPTTSTTGGDINA